MIILGRGTCEDPESFVRGGQTKFPTLSMFFFLGEGEKNQKPLSAGHHRPASEMPFKWRFAGWPIIA